VPIDLLGLTSPQAIDAALRLLPSGAGVAGRVYARALATGRLEPEAFGLSRPSCRAWHDAFVVGSLAVRRTAAETGDRGTTVKAVLATADGHEIECVRIPIAVPEGGAPRSTLCISSQVGCGQGCAFCETGLDGLVRNLTAAEIVAQVVATRSLWGGLPQHRVHGHKELLIISMVGSAPRARMAAFGIRRAVDGLHRGRRRGCRPLHDPGSA
jgi:hypothetical protein